MKYAVLALLVASCATTDPRAKELARLQSIRIAADAAFAAYYLSESDAAIREAKREGSGLNGYDDKMRQARILRAEVEQLVVAIDAAALEAAKLIDGDMLCRAPFSSMSRLVGRLSALVRALGLPLVDEKPMMPRPPPGRPHGYVAPGARAPDRNRVGRVGNGSAREVGRARRSAPSGKANRAGPVGRAAADRDSGAHR